MKKLTSIRSVAVGAALIVSVVALLLGHGAGTALTPLAQAAVVTGRESGAQVAITQTVTLAGSQQPLTIKGSGFVDARDGTGLIRLDLSTVPGLTALPGGAVETVLYSRTGQVYFNSPYLAGQLPPGKRWIELNFNQAANTAGIDAHGLSPSSSDPSQYLKYLYGGGGIKKLGTAMVDGVATTHYQATINVSQALKFAPTSKRQALAALLGQVTGGTGSLPAQVWIDTEHRVRREELGFKFHPGKAFPVTLGTTTIDFVRFGRAFQVRVPPENQVVNATSLGLGEPAP
jgi:hypothetical protein